MKMPRPPPRLSSSGAPGSGMAWARGIEGLARIAYLHPNLLRVDAHQQHNRPLTRLAMANHVAHNFFDRNVQVGLHVLVEVMVSPKGIQQFRGPREVSQVTGNFQAEFLPQGTHEPSVPIPPADANDENTGVLRYLPCSPTVTFPFPDIFMTIDPLWS